MTQFNFFFFFLNAIFHNDIPQGMQNFFVHFESLILSVEQSAFIFYDMKFYEMHIWVILVDL